ncbi:MAG: NAD(P)H-dependent oxidoreductase [Deltaproteobacteria bacterium]|nr:NAD(P)H-dependent oxidoreductase [Deltaproteobacteria bacterium]
MKKVLILFAHPRFEKSRANKALLAEVRGLDFVTVHDLYELYPDFNIDIGREKMLLAAHQLIIWQFPLYMYGPPALLKHWIDLVLEHGWAHGSGGCSLEKKQLFIAVTTGGSREAYGADGFNRFALSELLRPLEQTACLCRMMYLPPFAVQGMASLTQEHLGRYALLYRLAIQGLCAGEADLAGIVRCEFLDVWATALLHQGAP